MIGFSNSIILKKTDYALIKAFRNQIDHLTFSISVKSLFAKEPIVHFYPETCRCSCGNPLKVWKTPTKTVATLAIGKFVAHETQLYCTECKRIYRSKELSELVPHQGRYGFDVLVYIGKTLFQRCRNEKEIQEELRQKNIPISIRAIGNLGRKFILYLALAHKKCRNKIKKIMSIRGGYILHLDGTCEGESPHLMSTLDAISAIVLDNVKLPSENADQIIPFLQRIKKTYGDPIALMHDMGKGIMTSIETVFPGINDYVCHYHYLRYEKLFITQVM